MLIWYGMHSTIRRLLTAGFTDVPGVTDADQNHRGLQGDL